MPATTERNINLDAPASTTADIENFVTPDNCERHRDNLAPCPAYSTLTTGESDAANTQSSTGDATLFENANEEDDNRTDSADTRSSNAGAALTALENAEEGNSINNAPHPCNASPLFAESSSSATSDVEPRWSKERNYSHGECDDIGATYVEERAPNLNLRFFRGLARRSREQRSSEPHSMNSDGATSHLHSASVSPFAASVRHFRSSLPSFRNSGATQTNSSRESAHHESMNSEHSKKLVSATLVEEEEPLEVAFAEKMSFFQLHWKRIVLAMLLFIMLTAFITTYLIVMAKRSTATQMPSIAPTSSPTFDPRSTLKIALERGNIRCGLYNDQNTDSINLSLCRAIAAVVLNNPESFVLVNVTTDNRFQMLRDRQVDVLVGGETHTVEREVFKDATFSTPYFYDGMVYAGKKTYVDCAENQKRYNECADLAICVEPNTTSHEFIQARFAPAFYRTGLYFEMLENNTCNVLAAERLQIMKIFDSGDNASVAQKYVIGNNTFTNDPLAIVTRNNDREWSDIVNWVVQALFFGERHGLTKDDALCETETVSSTVPSRKSFLNAVYCVGNYEEIFYDDQLGTVFRTDINNLNNGTGMFYATPLGDPKTQSIKSDTMMHDIKNRKHLNCGTIVEDGYSVNTSNVSSLYGMGVSYCQSLSAAIFNGDASAVIFSPFTDGERALSALANRTIDVLVGLQADFQSDFGMSSTRGVTFSMPYYYGNETGQDDVSQFSFTTREEDAIFSSFVNCVVLATVHAADRGIEQDDYSKMPLKPLFGDEFRLFLRDIIYANGNYDEIYAKNFGQNDSFPDRGRNNLNLDNRPQHLELPGTEWVITSRMIATLYIVDTVTLLKISDNRATLLVIQ